MLRDAAESAPPATTAAVFCLILNGEKQKFNWEMNILLSKIATKPGNREIKNKTKYFVYYHPFASIIFYKCDTMDSFIFNF